MITTTTVHGAVEWADTAPDGTRIRLRSPGPGAPAWRLSVDSRSADGASPDEAIANWIGRLTTDTHAPSRTVLLVLQVATRARLWALEHPQ